MKWIEIWAALKVIEVAIGCTIVGIIILAMIYCGVRYVIDDMKETKKRNKK